MELNPGQKLALGKMLSGKNVFLSGAAGTGKSTVLKSYLEETDRRRRAVVVCAPTGIAALNVGGSTIHKAFKAKRDPFTDRKGAKFRIPEIIEAAETIVIDEISMCRIDLFQYVGRVIQKENDNRLLNGGNKKPIQLIVVGDFFQLPPVLTSKEKHVIEECYGHGRLFAFQSRAWRDFGFEMLVLDEVVRQDNEMFIDHLNSVREGNPDKSEWFEENTSSLEIKDAITLCPTNKGASEINNKKLAEIDEKPSTFIANIEGIVAPSEYPTEEELVLKVGARVIMLNNDRGGRWVNGTIATVTDVTPRVCVCTPRCKRAEVERYRWEYEEYTIDPKTRKLSKTVVGSFDQLPMRLAYAITIHKSQGQTFDSANIDPSVFDSGMLYVALSRVRSAQGIYLMEEIEPARIRANKAVIEFYKNPECIEVFEDAEIGLPDIATGHENQRVRTSPLRAVHSLRELTKRKK